MLIVDGLSDRYTTVTDRESDWGGTPYAFGSIWNFGGPTPIGANAPDRVEQHPKWRDEDGSSLAGIAAVPEAADNNAPALALLTDLAWTPGTVDLDDWFAAYALSRYGGPDRHAAAAWRTIRDTAYAMSRADSWSREVIVGLGVKFEPCGISVEPGQRLRIRAVDCYRSSPRALALT